MTDPTPQPLAPEASTHAGAPPPEASGAAPRRFLLARLAGAIRRQDWFTVLVEIAIVVLGVVIGFQVTAWGQARSDRAKEQAYLVQLEEDLRQTLQRVGQAEAEIAPRARATTQVVRAFRMPAPPPEDSLRTWLAQTFRYSDAVPVTGTTEALVATGDLALLRDDSLRQAVPAYLSETQRALDLQRVVIQGFRDNSFDALDVIDVLDLYETTLSQAAIDSLTQTSDTFPFPTGPRTRPFPVRATDLLTDRRAYRILAVASVQHANHAFALNQMREDAERLLGYVVAARGVRPPAGAPPDTTARRP